MGLKTEGGRRRCGLFRARNGRIAWDLSLSERATPRDPQCDESPSNADLQRTIRYRPAWNGFVFQTGTISPSDSASFFWFASKVRNCRAFSWVAAAT